MKDNKRAKVLLKVIQRIYDKNQEIQEVIDASIIEVCAKEGVYPEVLFIFFFFGVVFIIMAILGKNLDKSAEVKKTAYGNYKGYIKKRKVLLVIIRVFSLVKHLV